VELSDLHTMSRRRVMQLGGLSAGAVLIGSALGRGAHADPMDPGGDGASDGDPHFTSRFDHSRSTAQAAGETSYNGWPIGTPASSIGVVSYYAPGTSILIPVKSGDVATVMMYVAGRFNAEVEGLRAGQVWGYDYRRNVNNPSVWSNHASGTAMDLNAVLHPNGAKNTFNQAQVAAIRRILAFCGEVIYWGGDYRGTTDEMHFEIDVPPGDFRLSALAARIRGGPTQPGCSSASFHDGRYDYFGVGGGGYIYQSGSYDGTNFSGWTAPVGAGFKSTIALTIHDGRYDLFGIGTDGGAYHISWDRGWAPGFSALGGRFQGGLAATYHEGRHDVFGTGTDGYIYQCGSYDGNSFSAWEQPVGGGFKSTPAVTYHGGQYDVFAMGTDNAFYRMSWNRGWQPRVKYSGRAMSAGLSATYHDGRYDVFGVGTDGVLYQNISEDGVKYSGWGAPVGRGFRSTPAAIYHNGRYDLFLQGANAVMNHVYWAGGWSPVSSVGGLFLP